jgi:hypothetical protein
MDEKEKRKREKIEKLLNSYFFQMQSLMQHFANKVMEVKFEE